MLPKRLRQSDNSRERMATGKIVVLKKPTRAMLPSYIDNANKVISLYNMGFNV
jgi:hypothetical protein